MMQWRLIAIESALWYLVTYFGNLVPQTHGWIFTINCFVSLAYYHLAPLFSNSTEKEREAVR